MNKYCSQGNKNRLKEFHLRFKSLLMNFNVIMQGEKERIYMRGLNSLFTKNNLLLNIQSDQSI
jgi:hypothetical protein